MRLPGSMSGERELFLHRATCAVKTDAQCRVAASEYGGGILVGEALPGDQLQKLAVGVAEPGKGAGGGIALADELGVIPASRVRLRRLQLPGKAQASPAGALLVANHAVGNPEQPRELAVRETVDSSPGGREGLGGYVFGVVAVDAAAQSECKDLIEMSVEAAIEAIDVRSLPSRVRSHCHIMSSQPGLLLRARSVPERLDDAASPALVRARSFTGLRVPSGDYAARPWSGGQSPSS